MELVTFHKMRTAVQSNASPLGGEDLRTLEEKVRDTLLATDVFDEVEVGSTEDLDNLVIAMCTFPADLSEAQVAQRLEQVWEDRLRFEFWAAHTTLVDSGQVELEGASRISTSGRYATVHIVAQKAVIPVQRAGAE